MLDRYILEALQKAILTAVGTSIPVKYVGRNIESPVSGKWWEVIFIPNNLQGECWGREQTYLGLVRLVLHWPADDQGAYPMLNEVNRVAALLPKGSKYSDAGNNVTVTITDNPNLLGTFEEAPEMTAALSLRYRCFKP